MMVSPPPVHPMMKNPAALFFATVLVSGLVIAQDSYDSAEQRALEAAFQKQMSGCRMTGHFTETGSDKPPQKDSYTITKVKKLRDEKWRFDAKIEYSGKSVTLPLTVDVFWANTTPTIQVSKLLVPTLGTFDARIVLHGDQYAGLWSGAGHGGYMYGEIERLAQPSQQGNDARWASWRGPHGSGVAPNSNPPTEWSEDSNIKWKTSLPGLGNSTPIVWRDRIYLTTAVETDEQAPTAGQSKPNPEAGSDRGRPGGNRGRRRGRGRRGGMGNKSAPTKVYDFRVIALNRDDGSTAWSKSVKRAVPHEGGHATGSQASNSPITDGEHIYAHFGSRGIHCLDMDGNLVWSKDLGQMRTRHQFGEGSSPALSGDTLVINWDHEGDSFVCALNKATGEQIWRKSRDEPTSWSSPLIVEVDGKKQAIISATNTSKAYDLATGEVIWSSTGMTTNAIPTPLVHNGVAYLMSGFRGAALQAVKLSGAQGDITETEHMLWRHNRQTSYVPSALLYGEHIYFLRSNNAVLSCLNIETGEPAFEGQRLSGLRTVYASPVGAGGRVYLPSREGATKVFQAGSTFEEIATNELDDIFDASPVVIADELYLRGHKSIYCIAETDE